MALGVLDGAEEAARGALRLDDGSGHESQREKRSQGAGLDGGGSPAGTLRNPIEHNLPFASSPEFVESEALSPSKAATAGRLFVKC